MNKTVAIMQPTYLPWSGYFNLIASVDTFAFLDDVQFERRSWQARNRILLQDREHMLTIPVRHVDRDTLVGEVPTSESHARWRKQHWDVLNSAYAKAPYGDEMLALLRPHYAGEGVVNLASFNISVITNLALALNLSARFVRTSTLGCDGIRSQRLINICEKLGATDYLSPQGSRIYLGRDGFQQHTNTTLSFQSFETAEYPQYRSEQFISHLSIVDAIANLGFAGAQSYITGIEQ